MKKPWTNPTGVPLSDSELKRVSKTWDLETWEQYLDWYQSPCSETLIDSASYDILCEHRSDTVYEEYGYSLDEALRSYCDDLLKTVPKCERKVLQLHFYEGLTEVEVAKLLKKSRSGVNLIKCRGLARLQKQNRGKKMAALHIMRGLVSKNEVENPSPWDSKHDPILGDLNAVIQRALEGLSETQRQIVYLRYFCDQSFSRIARQLAIGINVAQEIGDVAVFKIKSRVASEMNTKMEVPSCA